MSWQCPICETVNQDVTPVCTVCDHLAPVIESYLSLETIDSLCEYNKKLDLIHTLEIEGHFEKMLDTSVEAIALYKENSLALDKAKHALIHLNRITLTEKLIANLKTAMDSKDLYMASAILKLADSLLISDKRLDTARADVKQKFSRINDVDNYLERSYKALIDLDIHSALQITEEGLIKHSNSRRLKARRDDLKKYITTLNNKEGSNLKQRSYHKSSYNKQDKSSKIDNTPTKGNHPSPTEKPKSTSTNKRKFPSIRATGLKIIKNL